MYKLYSDQYTASTSTQIYTYLHGHEYLYLAQGIYNCTNIYIKLQAPISYRTRMVQVKKLLSLYM